MLTHHVLFWLKPTTNDQQKQDFRNGLDSLKGIESIENIFIGTPAAIDRPVVDITYTFSLLIIFEDLEAHNAYQVHHIHQTFLDNFRSLFEKVIIYDSE